MKAPRSAARVVLSILGMVVLVLGACAPAAPAPAPKPTVAPPTPAPGVALPTSTPAPPPAVARPAPTPTPAPVAPAKPAAAEKPRRGGVLTFPIAGDLATTDPHTHTVGIIFHTAYTHYSNLVWWDPTADERRTKITGDLAEKWETSPDGTVYTFYLRQDARFHDGQPVTAEDVKFSLDRIAFPPKGMPSPRKEDLGAVDKIEVVDRYTLKVTLKYPSASFLPFMAGPAIVVVPKHLVEKDNEALKKKPVGSGPFVLKEYLRGVSYEVARNPNYYKPGLPYLDGIRAFVVGDVQARVAALRSGQVMMLQPYSSPISPAQRAVLLKDMGDKVVAEVGLYDRGFNMLALNNKRKPFTDARVRRAVSMGLYRQGMFDVVWQGLGQVSGPMVQGPYSLPKAELETYPGYEPDMKARIAKAKQLLAEAGYPDGFEMTVTTRADLSYFVGIMEYAVSELPKIGIKAKARPMESGALYAELDVAGHQGYGGNIGVSDPDPDSIIGTLFTTWGGRNYAHMSDPKIDELFEKQRRELDPQKRKEIVWEIQRILLREAYWPIFGQMPVIGVWVKQVRGNVRGASYDYEGKWEQVWLAE